MNAVGEWIVVENLEEDGIKKTDKGIFIPGADKANVGHFKVLSVGEHIENCEISNGDTIWALSHNVSYSSNFESEKIGIVKYANVMSKD